MTEASDYYRDKVAVVTGGASGIGLALCETMLGYGARRIVIGDFNDENLNRETARLEATHPGRVLGVHCDVTDEAQVQQLIARAAEFGDGHIDFLFNNAGAGFAGYFDKLTNDDWRRAFDLNFYSAIYGVRAVLPVMRAQGGGHIVNIISGIAWAPMSQQSMYASTKAALNMFGLVLRYELVGREDSGLLRHPGHDDHRDLGRFAAAPWRADRRAVSAPGPRRGGAQRPHRHG